MSHRSTSSLRSRQRRAERRRGGARSRRYPSNDRRFSAAGGRSPSFQCSTAPRVPIRGDGEREVGRGGEAPRVACATRFPRWWRTTGIPPSRRISRAERRPEDRVLAHPRDADVEGLRQRHGGGARSQFEVCGAAIRHEAPIRGRSPSGFQPVADQNTRARGMSASPAALGQATTFYQRANAQSTPPCGTLTGCGIFVLSSTCSRSASTPQPESTATYCTPSTS